MENRAGKGTALRWAALGAALLCLVISACAPKEAAQSETEPQPVSVSAPAAEEEAAPPTLGQRREETAAAAEAGRENAEETEAAAPPAAEEPPEETDPPAESGETPAGTEAEAEAEAQAPAGPEPEEPEPEDESWKLILVNAEHPIPEGYEFTLMELRNGQHVDERIYPELQRMFDDARAEGIYPFVNESYRTAEEQQAIMDEYIARYEAAGSEHEEAVRQAREIVALPGTSEHQLGLALDIIAEFSEDSWPTWQWLKDNCARYGFILRYPADKTEITGIAYEPWHFRYVGAEAAAEIMERGLALEEYAAEKSAAEN